MKYLPFEFTHVTGHYTPSVGTNAMGSAKNKIDIKFTRYDLGATYICQSFVQGLNHSLSVHIGIELNGKYHYSFFRHFFTYIYVHAPED